MSLGGDAEAKKSKKANFFTTFEILKFAQSDKVSTNPIQQFTLYVKLCTSRLCIKMSSFLFVRGCAMPRILYLSCEVPFPVWTPDDISGLISVVPWLSREELSKKNCR